MKTERIAYTLLALSALLAVATFVLALIAVWSGDGAEAARWARTAGITGGASFIAVFVGGGLLI